MFKIMMLLMHIAYDFLIPAQKIAIDKERVTIKQYIYYSIKCIVITLPILVFIKYHYWQEVLPSIALLICLQVISNVVITQMRQHIYAESLPKILYLVLFMLDQMLLIVVIFIIAYGRMLEPSTMIHRLAGIMFLGRDFSIKYFNMLFIIIYTALSGMCVVPLILDVIYQEVSDYSERINAIGKNKIQDEEIIDKVKTGKWIGAFERTLILMALFANQISSIGFIIAIKSLARFKLMENKIFSEYYLIGTLVSIIYTFVIYGSFSVLF